jgi:hypothetical protein
VAQNILGVSSPIIRSLQLHYQSLVLPLERSGWSVVGRGLAEHSLKIINFLVKIHARLIKKKSSDHKIPEGKNFCSEYIE